MCVNKVHRNKIFLLIFVASYFYQEEMVEKKI